MAQQLAAIPNGSNLLLDTNVVVYGLTDKSAQCKTLLERCSNEELTGVTLFEILHEATHKFMIAEAEEKGLFAGQPERGAKYLGRNPARVRTLSDYWTNTQRFLALNLLFLPMEEDIINTAQRERLNAGLLTNDSII